MGEDHRKSFLEQMPGILTGIAAVIASVGGILAYYHFTPSPSPSSTASPSQQFVCGTQLPGVTLFGIWRWSGTVQDATESGIWTFKSDCTYKNIVKSGIIANDEGSFLVSSSASAIPSITITNKLSGKTHIYLITNISENSFHASSLDYIVNLDFIRAS